MAETKAEEEDDEGFGDFSFASSFPNYNQTHQSVNSPIQINGNNDDGFGDEEWGDFVEYPIIQAPIPNVVDPFNNFFSNPNAKSVPINGVELAEAKTQWVTHKGALPLSLFGDDAAEEEEEQSGVVDPLSESFAGFYNSKSRESNVRLGVGINDIIANLYGQMKSENGFHSNSSPPGSSNFNLNSDPILLNSNPDLVDENKLISRSNELHSLSHSNNGGISSDATSNNRLNSSLNSVIVDQEFDDDDDDEGWDFKDAYSHSKVPNGNDKVQEFFEESVHDGSHGPIDLFAAANGVSGESHKMDIGFDLKPSTVVQNGFISVSYFQTEWKNAENGLNSHPLARSADSDENFGEVEAAFSEAGSKQKMQEFSEETMFLLGLHDGSQGATDLFAAVNGVSGESHNRDNGFDFKSNTVVQNGLISDSYFHAEWKDTNNGLNSYPLTESAASNENFGEYESVFTEDISKHKGNAASSDNRKGAVPLSIFGIEEPEADDSSDIQHEFVFKPPTHGRNVLSQSSNLSINDLLSNLYSQAEPIPSVDSVQKTTENGLHSTAGLFNSNLVGGDDDFDDGPWEFKDAVPESRVENQTSLPCLVDANKRISTIRKSNDFVDFYCKLKDDLSFVLRCHLDSRKKTRSTAALSGEEAKVAAVDEEIQEALGDLHQENIISEEWQPDDCPERYICLKAHLETLHEPSFLALDSEYQLSRRLSSAESDVKSATELIKHCTTMLNILTLVPTEEQSDYISTWSKMISVCAEELKHGAWIWKQSLEKNVQSEILSEPRGKQFILALGEIYRAVVVLGASAKFYKPWILLSSVDLTGIYSLLEECHTLWSASGIEEAIPNISHLVGTNYKGDIKSLLESIKHIRDIDALALVNKVFSGQESLCRLSLLTPGVVPDIKLVVWNGEKYFLTLANLWANLISCNPPKLPCLHVG